MPATRHWKSCRHFIPLPWMKVKVMKVKVIQTAKYSS